MNLIIIFTLVMVLFLLCVLFDDYRTFKQSYHSYSYIKNVWHKKSFNIEFDKNSDEFLIYLINNFQPTVKCNEYYICTDNVKFILGYSNGIVKLEHVDFDATLIETNDISYELHKCIISAQKKLTESRGC